MTPDGQGARGHPTRRADALAPEPPAGWGRCCTIQGTLASRALKTARSHAETGKTSIRGFEGKAELFRCETSRFRKAHAGLDGSKGRLGENHAAADYWDWISSIRGYVKDRRSGVAVIHNRFKWGRSNFGFYVPQDGVCSAYHGLSHVVSLIAKRPRGWRSKKDSRVGPGRGIGARMGVDLDPAVLGSFFR